MIYSNWATDDELWFRENLIIQKLNEDVKPWLHQEYNSFNAERIRAVVREALGMFLVLRHGACDVVDETEDFDLLVYDVTAEEKAISSEWAVRGLTTTGKAVIKEFVDRLNTYIACQLH